MGNEMGNNNTSGLQEESNNTTSEAPEKSLQEVGNADDVNGENYVIPAAETKDYHEKVENSASDDPKEQGDSHVDDQKSGERDQEETEVDPPPSNSQAADVTEKSLQEPLQQDDAKGEDSIIHPPETKQCHQEVANSVSNDPKLADDTCVDNQKSSERELKESEVHRPSISEAADGPEKALPEVVHADDMKGEEHVIPQAESEDYHEKVVSSALDDPTEVGDAHDDNPTSPEREQEETELHPPSIRSSADTTAKSLQEVVNEKKGENDMNIPAETQNYHENVFSSTTDDLKIVKDAHFDNQMSEEREQEETRVHSPTHNNSTDAQKESLQVPISDDDVKEEDHVLSPAGHMNCHEKLASSSSGDPKAVEDTPVNDQKSGERDQEENIAKLPGNSNEVDASEKSWQGSLHEDDVKNVTSPGENKESSEEVANLASDHSMEEGDPCVVNKTSEKETEANVVESLKVAVKSNEADAEGNKVRHASLSIGLEDCQESSLENNQLGIVKFQLEKQTSIKKAEEEGTTIQEPKKYGDIESDQHESAEVFAEPSIQDVNEYPEGSNSTLAMGLMYHSNENGHLLQTYMSIDQGRSVMPNSTLDVIEKGGVLSTKETSSQEEKPVWEAKSQIKDGNGVEGGLSKTTALDSPNDSSKPLPDAIHQAKSLSNPQEFLEPEDKCMVLTEETKLTGQELATEENKIDHKLSQLSKESVSESKIKVSNPSPADSIVNGLNQEINEEAKFAVNVFQGEVCVSNQNEAPREGSEGEAVAAPGLGKASEELSDCKGQEVEASYVIQIDTKERETTEQSIPETPAVMSQCPVSQDNVNNVDKSLEPIMELDQQNVLALPPLAAKYGVTAAEMIKTSANQPNMQCPKDETSRFSCGSCETQSVGRSSSESNPDIHALLRKSPSFNIDLQVEASKGESEQTPLLYQDKTQTQSSSDQSEVRVVTLETSDSDKSRTPFLGFLKEEEEANIVITPQKQENHGSAKKSANGMLKSSTKEVPSSSLKAKEKRKPRPFLFGTCMCCAAVIN